MNLRLKPTNIKKNTYPLYKMDINKYGENIFKSTRKEINKGLLKK